MMLRTYQPITHSIFTLHSYVEHLVCQVWCNANPNDSCESLLEENFEVIYNSYSWLKTAVDDVYEKCKLLNEDQKTEIREAFNINNRIDEICNGSLAPIELSALPSVVEDGMKPLLKKFYFDLLDLAQVPGNKLDYYNKLIKSNEYSTCPCCGLSPIESAETHYREDNDHYLPVAHFPFAAVNFRNLVPLCGKCNKKCKGSKNPCKNGKISFFAFDTTRAKIQINLQILDSLDLNYLKLKNSDLEITFSEDPNKIETWNWLYNIDDRYKEETKRFSKTELRIMANRLFRNNKRNNGLTYEEILDDTIEDYETEIFEDRKFLKVPFLQEIKNKPEWMAVYQSLLST